MSPPADPPCKGDWQPFALGYILPFRAEGNLMRNRGILYVAGAAALSVSAYLIAQPTQVVTVKAVDIGGVVGSEKGPEAGYG